jgi:nucleoid-associated protein YgaU
MHFKHNYKIYGLAVLLSIFTFYCGEPIPVEEMGNAKYEITRAENVKADVYAKETLESARAALFEAHDLVTKSKLKEAKEKAIEAGNLAQEAYNKAVPELAKETKIEAEEMLKEADRAFAEELAPEPYENAKTLLASGDESMTAEKYYEAFQSFENAREEAIKARNLSEAQAESIEREIIAVEDLIKEAIEYGANESTPDKITEAENAVKRAHEFLDNKYLKDAHNESNKAKANAEEAAKMAKSNYAAKKKLEASGAVAEAEKEMVNLKAELENAKLKENLAKSDEAQESLKNAEETLTAAQESLNNSGQSLEKEEYTVSIEHSNEAIRLSKLVKDQIPALLVLIKQSPTQEVASVSSGVETTKKGAEALGEGWKVYTVRLIPERRDCLWRIAEYKNIYNDPFKWTRIYKANKHQIKNPDLIYPGQVFDIPPVAGEIIKPVKSETKSEIKGSDNNGTAIDRPRMESDTKNTNSDNNTESQVDNTN